MIRHASRAVPWGLVVMGCALVPALMAITAAWPRAMWPLQGMTIGLLAAVAAWSMDERAAAVIDTLPRPLWWRTAARAAATVPLASVWVACVLLAGDRLPDHPALFVLQGVAALLAGVALATWRRSRGGAMPGLVIAPAAVVITTGLALVRPVPERLPLFPIWEYERWGLSAAIWWGVLGGAMGLLAVAIQTHGTIPRPNRSYRIHGREVS